MGCTLKDIKPVKLNGSKVKAFKGLRLTNPVVGGRKIRSPIG